MAGKDKHIRRKELMAQLKNIISSLEKALESDKGEKRAAQEATPVAVEKRAMNFEFIPHKGVRKTRSFEFRGGSINRCACVKRNGLQDYCKLLDCMGRGECLVATDPGCSSGKEANRKLMEINREMDKTFPYESNKVHREKNKSPRDHSHQMADRPTDRKQFNDQIKDPYPYMPVQYRQFTSAHNLADNMNQVAKAGPYEQPTNNLKSAQVQQRLDQPVQDENQPPPQYHHNQFQVPVNLQHCNAPDFKNYSPQYPIYDKCFNYPPQFPPQHPEYPQTYHKPINPNYRNINNDVALTYQNHYNPYQNQQLNRNHGIPNPVDYSYENYPKQFNYQPGNFNYPTPQVNTAYF